jgi:hypothetical protein
MKLVHLRPYSGCIAVFLLYLLCVVSVVDG